MAVVSLEGPPEGADGAAIRIPKPAPAHTHAGAKGSGYRGPASARLVFDEPPLRRPLRTTDTACATQHHARPRLGVVVLLACLASAPMHAEVTLTEREGEAVITTDRYSATIATDRGVLTSITDLAAGRELPFIRSGLCITEERERPEWSGAWSPEPVVHEEWLLPATVRFEQREGLVVCTSEWSCAAGDVTTQMTFKDGSPIILVYYRLGLQRPGEEMQFRLDTNERAFFDRARSWPGEERILSRRNQMAHHRPAPGWVHHHDGGTGLGLMSTSGVRALSHAIEPGNNVVQVAAYSELLRHREVPCNVTLETRIIVGGTPDEVARLYRETTRNLRRFVISDLEVSRLVYRPGEPGRAVATITNNTDQQETVVVDGVIGGGLGQTRELPQQAVTLPAGGETKATIEWENPEEHGFHLIVRAQGTVTGELTTAMEYFAVAENFSRVGQITIFNPGWFNSPWMVERWVRWARRNYIGTIEYYCWAPDQVFDLTPDAEEFEPHTESQRAYRAHLTRSLLQELVRGAHEGGLRVLAMDTGMASLHGVLDHPEWAKYTAEGQVYLYNGTLHDGLRFNAAPAHLFTPERVRAWADEMCASVDMFGWDGVRFDWNFIPIAPQDPLQTEDQQVWYDFQGRSAHELYPDPDATAAELCRLWRDTVAARHPHFVYHGNYQVDEELAARFPRYSQTVCRGSGILREGLLNVAQRYPTWQEWTDALMNSTRAIRRLGGQPSVGHMRGYGPGSVAHRVIHYIMMAAGYHWYGSAYARGSIDDTHTRFRHALRFSEYFYGTDFIPAEDPEALVSVEGEGAERVLWRPFVFVRERDGVRETLVHLVNLPADDHIIMRHLQPHIREGLTVSVRLPAGAEVLDCHVLEPDPAPHAEAIRYSREGGAVTCSIELREMTSLLVRSRVG